MSPWIWLKDRSTLSSVVSQMYRFWIIWFLGKFFKYKKGFLPTIAIFLNDGDSLIPFQRLTNSIMPKSYNRCCGREASVPGQFFLFILCTFRLNMMLFWVHINLKIYIKSSYLELLPLTEEFIAVLYICWASLPDRPTIMYSLASKNAMIIILNMYLNF